MQITDPIADMLTRIRNAGNARHASVDVPASKMKKAIAQILLDEGYIKSFETLEGNTQGIIRITLKYVDGRQKAISGLKRVSKPGLRVYAGADSLSVTFPLHFCQIGSAYQVATVSPAFSTSIRWRTSE